jgi:hypothetical protein
VCVKGNESDDDNKDQKRSDERLRLDKKEDPEVYEEREEIYARLGVGDSDYFRSGGVNG